MIANYARIPIEAAKRALPTFHGRKSVLPELPSKTEVKGLSNFAEAFKREFAGLDAQMRREMNNPFWLMFDEPDPWDEAVKWIERNEAAKAEWPWPERRGC
jgi:hypothetical protein